MSGRDPIAPADACPQCDGTGEEYVEAEGAFAICGDCDGTGKKYEPPTLPVRWNGTSYDALDCGQWRPLVS